MGRPWQVRASAEPETFAVLLTSLIRWLATRPLTRPELLLAIYGVQSAYFRRIVAYISACTA